MSDARLTFIVHLPGRPEQRVLDDVDPPLSLGAARG